MTNTLTALYCDTRKGHKTLYPASFAKATEAERRQKMRHTLPACRVGKAGKLALHDARFASVRAFGASLRKCPFCNICYNFIKTHHLSNLYRDTCIIHKTLYLDCKNTRHGPEASGPTLSNYTAGLLWAISCIPGHYGHDLIIKTDLRQLY